VAQSAEHRRGAPSLRGAVPATEWQAENRIIPCVSFNGAWPDTASEDEARRRVGVNGFRFVVGHFAPTLPYKGTRLFLEALTQIRRPDVAFVIFGECHDQSLAREIESTARSRPELKIRFRAAPG